MSTSGILDFERLLAPISEEHPTGLDLRTDPAGAMLYRDSFRSFLCKIGRETTLDDAGPTGWPPPELETRS